ncbi:MAG: tRNA lysidine(34) synthetase TilS [Devosia sp.]
MPGLTDPATLRRGFGDRLAPLAGHRAIGLAVSGGADSLALMLLMAEWARGASTSPRLIVYTLDHGLRPEAADEAAFVVREAERLGLPARSLRWNGEKPAAGVQAAAREARYRLIGEAMRIDGATMLLTAHHALDQAETVLMRLAHGSGLDGLRGMEVISEVEGVPVFRPLLDVPPDLLRAVVAEAGLTPAADPGNVDPHYERVRWREAMPAFAGVGLTDDRISQFARRAGEADDALSQWADERFVALVTVDPLGTARLSHAEFARLPKAVGVKLVGRLLDFAGGGQNARALGALERLHQRLVDEPSSRALTTLGALVARRGDILWFARESGRQAASVTTIRPREKLLWDRRFRIINRSTSTLGVRMARDFSRRRAEQLVGADIAGPAASIRSAPLISAPDGRVMALGCYRLDDNITVELSVGDAPLPQP